MLASVQCALVVNSVFHVWSDDALASFWRAFVATKWLSWKKALYCSLSLQLVGYFFYVVVDVDWAAMLNVLAFIYLAGAGRSFMIMYCTFIVVSILFDLIELAELPAFSAMTSGQAFGAAVWIVIFVLKPVIVGSMIAVDRYEGADAPPPAGGDGHPWSQFDAHATGDYEVDDDDLPEDERVAA